MEPRRLKEAEITALLKEWGDELVLPLTVRLRMLLRAEYDAAIAAQPRRKWAIEPSLKDAMRALDAVERARETIRVRGGDGSHG